VGHPRLSGHIAVQNTALNCVSFVLGILTCYYANSIHEDKKLHFLHEL